MKMMLLILLSLFQVIACSDSASPALASKEIANWDSPLHTAYVPTGFYFLAEGQKGINMRKEKSNETYVLAPLPFASVNNIIKTELTRTKLKDGIYTELCMTFDNIGTKDLEEGTGNPLHPKMAVVITNKLMYVVDNTVKIKTGVMFVGLIGYSEQEMKIMKKAVDNKK
jgi:hypothetical protein